ncbi:meta-pathway of phenol degradation family protein [Neisseria leonii]|uniref:Meta-pathway of phenol degradation family protein n=1 Tax=Neisseria leonii TaxID=2995413 RepID=A0AAQ3V0X0_9NEIS
MKLKILFPIFTLSLCTFTRADLPLSLEDILTDKGKVKLESSIAYINSERSKNQFANPIYIQTANNTFVAVPTTLDNTDSNSDMLVGTAGLRYGLTGKTDIYGSASYLWRSSREFDGSGSLKNSSRRFSDVSLGVSHTFMQDGKNPALIGFAETTLYEKSHGKSSSGKSWTIGATTYKAIDPIVLSFTGAYRHNLKKKTADGNDFQAGNYIMLNPSVSFAANDKISLTGGVQWLNAQADKTNGEKLSSRNTSTYAHAGVGFGVTRDTALNASVRWKVSGQSNSELKLGLTHNF